MNADGRPGCGRWVVLAALWPVAGALVAAVIAAVTAIGMAEPTGTGVIVAAGCALGLVSGAITGAFCAIAPLPGDSGAARTAWPVAAGITGLVATPLLRQVRDEMTVGSTIFVVAFPAALGWLAAVLLHESDCLRPIRLQRPAIGVPLGLLATIVVVGVGGELRNGSDLDVRSGSTSDGVRWFVADDGYSFAAVAEIGGGIVARLDHRAGDDRWFRFDGSWRPSPAPPFDATKPRRFQSDGIELAAGGEWVLAIEVATGEIMRTDDGVTWRRVAALPAGATDFDVAPGVIVATGGGAVSVLALDGEVSGRWVELPVRGEVASVSTGSVVVVAADGWFAAPLVDVRATVRVDPPTAGCNLDDDSFREQRLEPALSETTHVASVPCAPVGARYVASIDGMSWRSVDLATELVGAFALGADMEPPAVDIEVNGRSAVVDRWIERRDGSRLVFMRDPGRDPVGGYCC